MHLSFCANRQILYSVKFGDRLIICSLAATPSAATNQTSQAGQPQHRSVSPPCASFSSQRAMADQHREGKRRHHPSPQAQHQCHVPLPNGVSSISLRLSAVSPALHTALPAAQMSDESHLSRHPLPGPCSPLHVRIVLGDSLPAGVIGST